MGQKDGIKPPPDVRKRPISLGVWEPIALLRCQLSEQ